MQYFDFKKLIDKYSNDFVIEIPSAGDFDDMGDYVAGEPKKKTLRGAIISHRESKIFKAGGTLTEQDRALYMLEPLDQSLEGAEILFKGKRYSIGSLLENSEFTGVYSYSLKFVSVFSEVGENA